MIKQTGTLISHLVCEGCGRTYDPRKIYTLCTHETCRYILSARYNLSEAKVKKEDLRTQPANMWRYKEFLPVYNEECIVTLGEGYTPLLKVSNLPTEGTEVFIKDESGNPTGSFKARGLSAAVSKAKELGIRKLVIPTAGNAGGALAAYAAKAGMQTLVCMPRQTPEAFKKEAKLLGAGVIEIDGNISDCGKLVQQKSANEDWFDVSTLKEPYRLEGKKTMGYEIAEQLNWEVPDIILYPTGGGTGLLGIWKAFSELEELGWIGARRPRMVAVQSDCCNGIQLAFQQAETESVYKDSGATIANGLRVPHPYANRGILKVIRESNGDAVSVSDGDILTALRELASREGLLVAPEGAALWHAFKALKRSGWIREGEKVLLLNTGSGYKYFDNIPV